ncbi:MAG: SWIM zinc finger family protein, partial [Hyphomicrobiaceae bacterium]
GRRSSSFVVGQQFSAELVYFPFRQPLRATIVHRDTNDAASSAWPQGLEEDPLASYWSAMRREPWLVEAPILLPPGRLHNVAQMTWWSALDSEVALPVAHKVSAVALGVDYDAMAAVWDGNRCHLLTGVSADWGRIAFND